MDTGMTISYANLVNETTERATLTSTSQDPEAEWMEWKPDNKIRNVVIGSVLLLVNALTLVTVVSTRSLRPHTKLLVGSLTCTDMLMGVITLLPRLFPWHHRSHEPLCLVRFTCVLTSVYGSCLSITSVTLDRALALTLPILYRTSVTVAKTLLAVVGVWVLSLLLAAASMAGGFAPGKSCDLILVLDTGGLLLMAYVLVACALLIVAMYAFIGVRLRRRSRQVRTELNVAVLQQPPLAPSAQSAAWPNPGRLNGSGGGGGGGVSGQDSQAVSMKLERRTTLTAMMLAVCFLMGYVPLAVYLLWVVHGDVDRLQEASTQRLLIIIVCPLLNCILDPIVYFWRLQNWNSCVLTGKCRRLVRSQENGDNSVGVVVTRMTRQTTT